MELASRLYGSPLAIHPDVLQFVTWARIELDDLKAWMSSESERIEAKAEPTEPGAVAVVPIRGSLFRGTFFDDYDEIGAEFQGAVEDPNVAAIVLDVDSPGGEVAGMLDLANTIHAARGSKPIIAVANDQATSAAYALASSADQVYVSPTATVGSIGVVALHVDGSQANAKAGVQITEIASGSKKTALSPNQPLSKLGRSMLENAVNSAAGEFFDLVARNRGLDRETVEAQEAGIYFGADAVEAGLADGVRSRSQVIRELAQAAPIIPTASAPALAAAAPVTVTGETEIETLNAEGTPMPTTEENQVEVEETPTEEIQATAAEPSADESAPGEADVVDLDAVRDEGRLAAQNDAREIVELCTIAGRAAEAAAFIAASATVEDVRAKLLETTVDAAGAEISNQVDAMTSAGSPQAELDPAAIYKARRELGRR